MQKILMVCFFILCSGSKAFATTILCLGDSLTEGYGVKPSEAWPSLLETSLKAKLKNIKVINAGISGATTASGPSRMKWHLKGAAKQPIDILVLSLGANDALRGLDFKAAEKNLIQTIELAKKAQIRVFLTAMKAPPSLGTPYTKDFEALFARVANIQKIDLVPFFLEGVAGNPKMNLADGIHPNPAGHILIAKYFETFFCSKLKCN